MLQVVLVANSKPALNDVTYSELIALMPKVFQLCPEFEEFINNESLIITDIESSSPCLNLKTVPTRLVEILDAKKCDLLILEGMGRAIHTNYGSQFKIGKGFLMRFWNYQITRLTRLYFCSANPAPPST